MIAKLTGKIDFISHDHVILEVNGVGFIVFCSQKVLASLNKIDNVISLLIETQMTDNSLVLFGFNSYKEKEVFGLLKKVQGVGFRVALAILSEYSADQIIAMLINKNENLLLSVSGIGPKICTRIINELHDKFIELFANNKEINVSHNDSHVYTDAVSALINLGYVRKQAHQEVEEIITNNKDIGVSEVISEALKKFGNKK